MRTATILPWGTDSPWQRTHHADYLVKEGRQYACAELIRPRVSRVLMMELALLRSTPKYCAVINKYASVKMDLQPTLEGLPLKAFLPSSGNKIRPSPQTANKLLHYYIMDVASLLPVCALDPRPDDSVLDMCAAPGGKSFAILQLLSPAGGLMVNDPSPSRMKRLRQVIRGCVPRDLAHMVSFSSHPGHRWGRIQPDGFERILVDAPCSSDRHEVADKGKELIHSNSKKLAIVQEELLHSALRSITTDGVVVYSTCTSSERENDQVVSNVLSRFTSNTNCVIRAHPFPRVPPALERVCHLTWTEYGVLASPSCPEKNSGPAYIARLQKLSKPAVRV